MTIQLLAFSLHWRSCFSTQVSWGIGHNPWRASRNSWLLHQKAYQSISWSPRWNSEWIYRCCLSHGQSRDNCYRRLYVWSIIWTGCRGDGWRGLDPYHGHFYTREASIFVCRRWSRTRLVGTWCSTRCIFWLCPFSSWQGRPSMTRSLRFSVGQLLSLFLCFFSFFVCWISLRNSL